MLCLSTLWDEATRTVPSRVLQVITDTDRRGAQVFASDLEAELLATGHDVATVALAPGSTGGLEVPILGSTRLGQSTLRALRRQITEAAVVIGHGSSTLPACALATVGTGVPFVYRQISDSLFWAPTVARRARVRWGLSRTSSVVALWQGSATTLETRFRVDRETLRVIPNGVPAARFPVIQAAHRRHARSRLMLGDTTPVLAYVGALVEEKGVDLAIRATAELGHTALVVAGDGPERSRLETLAADLAPGRVVFTGSVAEPRAVYAAADAVVLPSRGGDSMPATLIEAGLLGLPVIATPVNGIPDIVIDGETGALVAINDVDALTRAVRALFDEPARARRLGDAARMHCRSRFGIDVVASQWASALAEVAPSTAAEN